MTDHLKAAALSPQREDTGEYVMVPRGKGHQLRHGHNRSPKKRTKEYRAWSHILGRCHNPNDGGFKWYGAKGIEVCSRWRESFDAFIEDMGLCPSAAHSIDRWPDNGGNYEPGNCRWATSAEQSRNTSRTILVSPGVCLKDACEKAGISYEAAQARLRRGCTLEQALSPLCGAAFRKMRAQHGA